ncbi:hypothetical protein BDY24DRAFT_411854 [Mrakia frigida]|uniref:WSC domain-containing protein n=1 Tax=Mrakia frigida TaxID=29902 RepID=UPI003FCC1BD6
MHSFAILLPALSLLGQAQAWSSSSHDHVVVERTTTTVVPDLGLQTFYGAIGGYYATAVTVGGRGYVIGSETVSSGELQNALQKSCTNQKNLCADASNAQPNAQKIWTVAQCETQLAACNGNVASAMAAATAPATTAGQASVSSRSTQSVASTISTASVASVSTQASVSKASVASAAAATTAASTTVPNLGIQGYYEAIGGIYATPVFCSGSDYVVGTVTWPSWGIYNALSTSCNDQLDKCAAAGFSGCSSQYGECISNEWMYVDVYNKNPSICVAPAVNLPASTSISLASAASVSSVKAASISSASYFSALTTASIASVSAVSASNVALSASASNSRVLASNSQASVSSVSAQSTLSTASVASQSAVSASSVASQASASSIAQALSASVSQSRIAASSASAAAQASNSALSVSAVASQSLQASASLASLAAVSSNSILASQSQASVASQSSISVSASQDQASRASASQTSVAAASVQSNLVIQSQLALSSVAAASIASVSVTSVASAAAASASASMASVSSVSATSVASAAAAASASANANAAPVLASGWALASTSLIAEGTNGRALISDYYSDPSMTPLICSNFCSSKGYPLAGTEYYQECYCGSVLSNGASLSGVSTSDRTPCSGGSSACGGFSALSLYYDTTKLSSSLVPLAGSGSGTGTTTPSLPSPYVVASSSLVAEGTSGRALTGDSTESASMTPAICGAYCTSKGFAISATEYSTQCFCGNTFENGASLSIHSSSSGMPCGGDAAQTCGGSSALSVVYNSDLATLSNGVITLTGSSSGGSTTPPASTVVLPAGYASASSSLIAEGSTGRALTGAFTSSASMTPTVCAEYCTAAGFAISATEYSQECFCGNEFSNGASLSLTSSNSPMPCGGDATQTCGAGSAMSVVYNTGLATLSNGVITLIGSTTTTPVSSTGLPAGYKSASSSIIAEGTGGRALTGASTSASDMTPSVCAVYCSKAGFAISGTEYARECYCSNTLSNGASLSILTSNTPTPCAGDNAITCGAGSGLSIAYDTALATLTNGVFTLVATTTPTVVLPAGYKSAASSLVAEGTNGRALPGASTSASDMTPSICAVYCTKAGFAISGTEWYTECYCSNSLSNGASLSLLSSSAGTPCGGDASQTCGGSSALSVVYNTALATLSNGVITAVGSSTTTPVSTVTLPSGYKSASSSLIAEGPSGNARALTGASFSSSSMTPTICATYCTAAGFALSGTEYSQECYCGNALSNGASLSLLSSASPMVCGGDATQTCGGASALSLVYNTALATLSNGVFTLIAPSATTTTTTPASTPTSSAAVTLDNGFSSTLLCYSELPGRAMTGAGFSSDVMTYKLCTDFCGNAGFSMGGVEWGRECYCSSTLVLSTLASNINCNVPCSGDSTAICGGPQALQIFTTTPKSDTSSTIASGWTSAPLCLAEPADGSRLFQDASLFDDKMTVAMCTDFCASKGSNQAGLEYGTQCFCATSLDLTKATISTGCNMAAGGAQTELAGGGNALSIWTLPVKSTRRRYLPMLSRRH